MKLPVLVHNRVSYAGAAVACLALILFVFLSVLHTTSGAAQAPYAGLLIFLVVPAVLLFGLLLIPVGMILERRTLRRTGHASMERFPVVDLNDARHRNGLFVVVVGSLVLLFLSVFGSFQVYEATESVAFCGQLCHSVMHPEYIAHRNAAHARVRCVDCHVGPGADWYLRSKLSGARQVYAVLFDRYPRPIPVPIKALRPARETCEQCHWREQFFGLQGKRLVHFLPDETNTRWEVNLLVKTGGGSPETGQTEGIHWHMNIANRVEYYAADATRQDIPWVRMTDAESGRVTEYMSTASELSRETITPERIRTMDCLDCHNRPTHVFRSPSWTVNLALANGTIDATLPFIKKIGVTLLAKDYGSTAQAVQEIEDGLGQFYREKYPELATSRHDAIDRAASGLQDIYRQNMFPEMKVRWDVYADNIGHLTSRGCYRCHDGLHESADGRVITTDCNACHTIIAQGKAGDVKYASNPQGLRFEHPEDIGDIWQAMQCSDCHTGGLP